MTPERWKQVEALFDQVADLAVEERAVYLDAAEAGIRDEVLALLAAEAEAASAIVARISGGVQNLHEDSATIAHAGPYRLKKEIGRGGMGTVYLAARDDGQYQGEVAIKLLRPGMDTGIFLERFRRERQALARLQHLNIARLLDSGTAADGSQYIVMELVDGEQIHTYCEEKKLTATGILELFLPVCRAVAYAHQQLIVHRDLKPGNILVTADGTPKLLDFGICKTLDDMDPNVTATGAHMLTPDFASPEQVLGNAITPASDVYGLGAVLYRLLTGRSPHVMEKYTAVEIARAVCEVEPVAPGISPDVDTVLLKALQKEPGRRYASAEQLAEDLRRVLANEPVLARADTALYRTTKFVRRHPVGVAATVVVLCSMTFGLVAYARQAAIATRQSAEARRLANAMIFTIHDKVQNLNGSLPARQEIVRLGLDYLDRLSAEAGGDAALRLEIAAAYNRIGNVQGAVFVAHTGDANGALVSYRKGLAMLEGLPVTREARDVKLDLLDRTAMLTSTRDMPEAVRLYEQVVPLAEEVAREAPGDVRAQRRLASAHSQFALLLRRPNPARSAEQASASIRIMRELLVKQPDSAEFREILASALASAGSVEVTLNHAAKACELYREAIGHRKYFLEKSPDNSRASRMLMLAYGHLGDALGSPDVANNLGDLAGAEAAYEEMLRIAERYHVANPGDQTASFDLAMSLSHVAALPTRPLAERIGMYERALPLFQRVVERDPENKLFRSNYFVYSEATADLQLANGRPVVARAILERIHREIPVGDLGQAAVRRVAVTVRAKLAQLALERRDGAGALALAREGVEIVDRFAKAEKSAAERLTRFTAYSALGRVLHAQKPAEAKEWISRAMAGYRGLEKDAAFRAVHRDELARLEKLAE